VAKRQPAQADDNGDENKTEDARDGRGREERGILRLAGIDDRLKPQTATVAGRTSRGVVTDERTDRRERGSDAEADKKIRERGWNAEREQLLGARGTIGTEKLYQISIGRDKALRGVYDEYYRKTRHEEPPGAIKPQIAKKETPDTKKPIARAAAAAQQTARNNQ